ncbi:hypothetical protein [Rhodococcus qingshengii]|uniref:hypothetical protein n=1 Tax=Rhodococcus qingshengii TaxID=334542 RepID=UPI00287FC36C|nr:hypothetical protein [Rhodococcus qingshengii]
MSNAPIEKCPECESQNLTWDVTSRVDQSLHVRPRVLAALGCNECSETLALIDSDVIANFLNEERTEHGHFLESADRQ